MNQGEVLRASSTVPGTQATIRRGCEEPSHLFRSWAPYLLPSHEEFPGKEGRVRLQAGKPLHASVLSWGHFQISQGQLDKTNPSTGVGWFQRPMRGAEATGEDGRGQKRLRIWPPLIMTVSVSNRRPGATEPHTISTPHVSEKGAPRDERKGGSREEKTILQWRWGQIWWVAGGNGLQKDKGLSTTRRVENLASEVSGKL